MGGSINVPAGFLSFLNLGRTGLCVKAWKTRFNFVPRAPDHLVGKIVVVMVLLETEGLCFSRLLKDASKGIEVPTPHLVAGLLHPSARIWSGVQVKAIDS